MNSYEQLLHDAIEQSRQKLNATQSIQIQKIYSDVAKKTIRQLKKDKTNKITRGWINAYLRSIKSTLISLNKQLNKMGVGSLKEVARTIASIKKEIILPEMKDVPDEYLRALTGVPKGAIDSIIKGNLYKDGKGLSKRVWNITNKYKKDIQIVLLEGMAQGKTYLELIEDLSNYVNPKARKSWEWSKVYPGTNRKVDYNAQRLMRTSINHAFYVSNVRSTQEDPFTTVMHWQLSSSHYERQIEPFGPDECDDFATQDDHKLGTGNFPKNKVPTPHPNCLCTQYPVYDKSFTDIGKEINRWIKGEKNKKLDDWWENFTPSDYYTV
ncbi:hypothetical protein [Clostridium kluyveri]|uniref:hypothetical protein n=1 Tax=Clostridium kluyveri TaxID=1534 RepID=UPI00224548D8|nr:hypothetical protein [Clostridium kluyveri]UZQ49102.1 hypothetical protein OP486_14185 [Clostridium kluyveri]